MGVYNCYISCVGDVQSTDEGLFSCVGNFTKVGSWQFDATNKKYETFVDSVDGGNKGLLSVNNVVYELNSVGNGRICEHIDLINSFNNPPVCFQACGFKHPGFHTGLPTTMIYTTIRNDSSCQYVGGLGLYNFPQGGETCAYRPTIVCYSYCALKLGSLFEFDCAFGGGGFYDVGIISCLNETPQSSLSRTSSVISVCVNPIYMCRSEYGDKYCIEWTCRDGDSAIGVWSNGSAGGGIVFTRFNQCLIPGSQFSGWTYCPNITHYVSVSRFRGPTVNPEAATQVSFFIGPHPTTPSITSPTSGNTILPTDVVQWSTSTNACCYQLQIGTQATYMNVCKENGNLNCTYTGVTCTSAVFNSIFTVPDGVYYMRVRSINNDFHSCWSGCVCFTLQSGFPHVGLSNGILVQSSAAQNGNMVLCSGTMYYRTASECSNRSITLTTATGILKVGCQ